MTCPGYKEKNEVGKQIYTIPILFFFLILGVSFCDIQEFVFPEFTPKWYWLYTGVSICGLLSIFIGCGRRRKFELIAGLLLFAYCVIRAVSGPFISSLISLCALSFLIYYLAGTVIQKQTFRYFAAAIAIVALFQALYGIAQYGGLLSSGSVSSFSVVGNFENPAGYASMLAFSLPFVFYFLNASGRSIEKYIAGGIYVAVLAAIVLSGSRAGIIAAVIISLLYILNRNKSLLLKTALWKKVAVLFLISVVLSGLYWVKKDSADGRMLIWRCTWDMIKEKPLFGHGYKSFEAEYMLYQARYFEQHPDSEFVPLADNVKHPFNECLLLIAEFGLVASLFLALVFAGVIRRYWRHPGDEQLILMMVLAATFVFSCFSYPFQYPFTWLIVGFSLGALPVLAYPDDARSKRHWTWRFFVSLASTVVLCFTIRDIYYEHRWFKAVKQAEAGRDMTYEYERLYPYFMSNYQFVYTYAVELNRTGRWDQSLAMITACEPMMNDYDVQMLKADDYKKLRDFQKAKDGYVLASQMCPNRFMPLYELVNAYDSLGQPEMALQLALEIIDKPVKVPSAAITVIKTRMQKRIGQDVADQVSDSGDN